ncbi:MAG: thiamine pyrophosphate-dependent dehydrogenase E1 component subunit alpha [Polaromonas sp.]
MKYSSDSIQSGDIPQARHVLEQMMRIRFLEEKIADLRKSGDIQGSVHLCIGQESIYSGACAALQPGDRVFSTYRGHGWAHACDVPAEGILAELLGRESGVCQGRGGSAYFSAPEWGFYGENSIVGAGAPIACGAALASVLAKDGSLAVTAFGDGAMNQGGVFEALNFAAYLKLPVIFVCENNTYAELTPLADTVRDPNLFKRSRAFGIEGVRIDGNDVLGVKDCIAHFGEKVRNGHGPVLIEMMTQRLVGHYIGDMQSYRSSAEIAEAKLHEPIVRLKKRLLNSGLSEADLQGIEDSALAHIEQSAATALQAPLASQDTVMDHLYA